MGKWGQLPLPTEREEECSEAGVATRKKGDPKASSWAGGKCRPENREGRVSNVSRYRRSRRLARKVVSRRKNKQARQNSMAGY